MYKAVREFELDVPPAALLQVVYDVRHYPEFVRGVRAVELLEDDGRRALAEFTAGLAGLEFRYTVQVQRDDEVVTWERVAGAFQDGKGQMRFLGEGRFRYENALDPGFAVPQLAVKFVLESTLPRLISDFSERARARHAAEAQAG